AQVVQQSCVSGLSEIELGVLPGSDSIGLLQHSSGTTGLKKGVALSYRSIVSQLDAYCRALKIDGVTEPRIASWLPLYHDMGLIASFLLPVWRGIPIISMDPFVWTSSPGLLLEATEQHQATHSLLPNFAFLHQPPTVRDDH